MAILPVPYAYGLQARHLYIDTSIYRNLSVNLRNPVFEQLRLAVQNKDLRLHIDRITLHEVRKQIRELADEAGKAHASAKKLYDRWHRRYAVPAPSAAAFDEEAEAGRAVAHFESCLRADFKAMEHGYDDVGAEAVIQRYLDKKPPFDEGKKEFPDAFILQVLGAWAEANDERVYVITADKAMHRGVGEFPRLIPLERIEDFLTIVAETDRPDVVLIGDALASDETFKKALETQLSHRLPEADFVFVGNGSEDADVMDVEFQSLRSIDSVNMVSLDRMRVTMVVRVTCVIQATIAHVEAEADWDEDGYVVNRSINTYLVDNDVSTKLAVTYSIEEPNDIEIDVISGAIGIDEGFTYVYEPHESEGD